MSTTTPTGHPAYVAALQREQRQTDALDRAMCLLLTHPEVDLAERVHLIRTLSTMDRRNR